MSDALMAAGATPESLLRLLVKLATRLARAFPGIVWNVINTAFQPRAHLRQLALVIAVQILSYLLRVFRERVVNRFDDVSVKRDIAQNYEEFLAAESELDTREAPSEEQLCKNDAEFFGQLQAKRETYEELVRAGDEYGLMFHLRSELIRRQTGGAGYNRDGSTWLRKHAAARDRIHAYQQAVCGALRYVASGEAPESSRSSERLAFINETRHAFGRTALLLSGGAAFGVKHLGVIKALHREALLPRIVCGTSAGSIVAAAVCVRSDDELNDLVDGGAEHLLCNLRFFGLRRGESSSDLLRSSGDFVSASVGVRKSAYGGHDGGHGGGNGGGHGGGHGGGGPTGHRASVEWDLRRGREHMRSTKNLLDSSVLSSTLLELMGEITFLEAFDKTGRVLNITVTRSDGRAPPLLCNYLTTPHLLVHSASLASCSIPGVFEAVELMARGRDGTPEPYFKTGSWTFTDGGLQADLPKERLTELFNVNQFIVSQVNPLAPLFVPVGGTGLPWLEEFNVFLKHQLVGFVQGVSKLGHGKLIRPGGFRGVDLVMQDYEGTVTIRPDWSLSELREFLANFDQARIKQYVKDGERAAWPHIQLIRSLCEVEFCLDEVAAELQRTLMVERQAARRAQREADAVSAAEGAAGRAAHAAGGDGGEASPSIALEPSRSASLSLRGKLPSYVSLEAYEGQHHEVGIGGVGSTGSLGSPGGVGGGSGGGALGTSPYPIGHASGGGSSVPRNPSDGKMPGVASFASLLALGGASSSMDVVTIPTRSSSLAPPSVRPLAADEEG